LAFANPSNNAPSAGVPGAPGPPPWVAYKLDTKIDLLNPSAIQTFAIDALGRPLNSMDAVLKLIALECARPRAPAALAPRLVEILLENSPASSTGGWLTIPADLPARDRAMEILAAPRQEVKYPWSDG